MEDTQDPCSHVVRDFREARSHQGDRPHLSPAFPAAEPVARVARVLPSIALSRPTQV